MNVHLKISLSHELGSANPLPTLFGTFSILIYSGLLVSGFH